MHSSRRSRGVSPIIGVLLLLGLTVSLLAMASTIIFGSVEHTESPQADIEITHIMDGDMANVTVRVLRNENVESFSYRVEAANGTVQRSRESFGTEPGTAKTIEGVESGSTVVVFGEVDSAYVLETYTVP